MDAELIARLNRARALTMDNPEAQDEIDAAILDIAALSATPQAESALRDLHAVVIEQNRLGASWHPEVFGRLMTALANANHVLDATPQAAQVQEGGDELRLAAGRLFFAAINIELMAEFREHFPRKHARLREAIEGIRPLLRDAAAQAQGPAAALDCGHESCDCRRYCQRAQAQGVAGA